MLDKPETRVEFMEQQDTRIIPKSPKSLHHKKLLKQRYYFIGQIFRANNFDVRNGFMLTNTCDRSLAEIVLPYGKVI